MSQALTMSEIENGPAKDWPTGFNDYADSLDFIYLMEVLLNSLMELAQTFIII